MPSIAKKRQYKSRGQYDDSNMPNWWWPYEGVGGNVIKLTRQEVGIAQAELARRSGISKSLVSEYETGKKDCTVNVLIRLIAACDREVRFQVLPLSSTDRVQYETDAIARRKGWSKVTTNSIKVLSIRPYVPRSHRAS